MKFGSSERATQNRVIKLFCDELGYRYLGNWGDRSNNHQVEEELLGDHLRKQGYSDKLIERALYVLKNEANHPNCSLYDSNRAVYSLMRYGIPIQPEVGKNRETVHLVDWQHPENNDFAIAEEVTLRGGHERRPDLVLYLNGLAVAVIELKRSSVSIGDGIRQLLSNQKPEFNSWFFSSVQIVFAGNDSEGLAYGSIGTPEKYFLRWKEDEDDDSRYRLDKYLIRMCRKERLLELLFDFILFDGGIKKLPRVHQYFGVKAAQEFVALKKDGIIWHTQGSGKSIVMILLAKWIVENRAKARVLIITDRTELDKQIGDFFVSAGITIYRTSSGNDLMTQLGLPDERLLCSLVHKFGRQGEDDFEGFIRELEKNPIVVAGDLFVFVDECHRSQSGRLHRAMKAILPRAVFFGFTGTPLLKQDRQTSLEVFGGRYIHTYKFNEAVEDKVVLDLIYEARDITQHLGSQERIDAWFEAKTKNLNAWQREELMKQWGTMQMVLSSRSRMDRVVQDILFDFSVYSDKKKPRLTSHRGNALLVASSIYEACKYFELFERTFLSGKCGIVTSYTPYAGDVSKEEIGENTETEKQYIYKTYEKLLEKVVPKSSKTKTETYEEAVKDLFIKQPANMKLLVVVDKLLTGFDAPTCTYLYIDKAMRDHGLFQAICRTNRLDGEDKDFGYIVDYKDLFKNLVNEENTGAMQVYTSELDDSVPGAPPEILMKNRLNVAREKLEQALEKLALLCEPVAPPKTDLEFIRYFCGNPEKQTDLQKHEPLREALYKGVVVLIRAYANIADELPDAGYNPEGIEAIKKSLDAYKKLREVIRKASGESLDLKPYEADMRHLIDTYIEADGARKISPFDNLTLMQLIVKSGIHEAVKSLPQGIQNRQETVAEAIENNVRRKIIREHLHDPAFYDKMSALLDEIIVALRAKAIEYEEYLYRIADLVGQVETGRSDDTPEQLKTPGLRALFNNLTNLDRGKALDLALQIDETIKRVRHDDWRGNRPRENEIKRHLLPLFDGNTGELERIFAIIEQQAEY
jgi:type I restriction enzyme R subunit